MSVRSVPEKLDLYKTHKDEYAAPKQPALVQIKPALYLAIDGAGKPGGEEFQARVGALYAAAFTIKMAKKRKGQDYAVCHLEGLWPQEDIAAGWTLLIRVPDFVRQRDLDEAVAALVKKDKPPEVAEVRLEKIDEGLCVQVLHTGPYAAEPETIARMGAFAGAKGVGPNGPHHEIYLSDPRRVAPEKLRTILRQPVKAAGS